MEKDGLAPFLYYYSPIFFRVCLICVRGESERWGGGARGRLRLVYVAESDSASEGCTRIGDVAGEGEFTRELEGPLEIRFSFCLLLSGPAVALG
jgi:hypothetical protein